VLELIHPFNYADVVIAIVLLFCVLISMRRGMVVEAIAIASWVGAIFVARTYGEQVAFNVIGERIPQLQIRRVIDRGG